MDFSVFLNNTYSLVLLIVLAVSFVALCLYYGMIWLRVGVYKNSRIPAPSEVGDKNLPSVSVVIVAHNEEEMLKRSLPYLLEQDYPDFEVVVVNYMSTDDTKFVLRVCSENYANMKTVTLNNDVNMFKGKKFPLSIGIKSASKDVILLTEASCMPTGFDWIRNMVCGYMRGASIVLGYSLLNDGKGLLNALQQYDNMAYTASYMGMAINGMPYTGTGRNLSHRRDFFFDRHGFLSHYVVEDGADDLFVNQNATKSNTAVILAPDAVVMRDPKDSYGQWRRERKERRCTRRYYGLKHRSVLAAYPLMQALFLASLLWLWIGGLFPWQILAAILALKIIWQILCSVYLGKRLNTKMIQYFSPIFELYFLFANTFLAISSLRIKK